MNNINYPLVTIGVVTYNSGDFILETLDSIKSQTYPNIELIVSDDCSSDDTVEKCKRWFAENANSFVRAELVTSPINTGVSGNSNRAFEKATGEWYKMFDGDDIMRPYAIDEFVKYVKDNPEVNFVFSQSKHFKKNVNEEKNYPDDHISDYLYRPDMTAKKQLSVISKLYLAPGPVFIKRSAIAKVGAFDERFPLLEDYPLFIKLVKNGNKIYLLNKQLVDKRMRNNSIQYSRESGTVFSKSDIRSIVDYKCKFISEVMTPLWRCFLAYSLGLRRAVIRFGNKRNGLSGLFFFLYKKTDPILWYRRMMNKRIEKYEASISK